MESSTAAPAPHTALEASTMGEAFRRTVETHPDAVAFRTGDDAVSLTWSQARERVDAIAGGLAGLGVGPGDVVALMLSNRPEFHLVDLAAVTLGATPFSIYTTYAPEQIAYVVGDAGARVVITEQALLPSVLEAANELPDLEHVIVVDGPPPAATGDPGGPSCVPLSDVEGSNPGFDVDAALAAVTPDDILTLIYTSGTTGPPKGVQLSHRNLLSVTAAIQDLIQLEPGSRVISWLPAAHVAERNAHHYIPIVYAGQVTTCENPREIIAFLPQVRPHWFFAVPRIWEKLKSGLEAMLAGAPEEQREPVQQALAAGLEKLRREQRGEEVPAELVERVARADAELFANLRTSLGLDQVVTVNVGAAPTPPDVLEFFHAIGIELAELWGMSETCGFGAVNPPGKVKIGTVGPAAPGAELKLAEDGELMIRGDFVMVGYRNMPDETGETMRDGWLLTGDIGEFDEDGYLTIVDRKKEIIINAAGKNMSPAHIESVLKGAGPLIGQAAVIGDQRPFNTALIVLDGEVARPWAAAQGIEDTSLPALVEDPRVREAVAAEVEVANSHLARVEQIKKFHLLGHEWEPGSAELTPTMKLKRKPIAEKYAEDIEALYRR